MEHYSSLLGGTVTKPIIRAKLTIATQTSRRLLRWSLHCWLKDTHWLDLRLKITVGPLTMAFTTRRTLRFSSERTWPSPITRSSGPFRLETSSASKAWNSLAAYTTAHSARVVRAREPLAFGTVGYPVFSPTTSFLESPVPGEQSERSETI